MTRVGVIVGFSVENLTPEMQLVVMLAIVFTIQSLYLGTHVYYDATCELARCFVGFELFSHLFVYFPFVLYEYSPFYAVAPFAVSVCLALMLRTDAAQEPNAYPKITEYRALP